MIENENILLTPRKRRGIIIHFVSICVILLLAYSMALQLNRISIGPLFILILLFSVFLFLLFLFFSYRLYGLAQAKYLITREGIFLKWGLREQMIPINEVLWLQIEEDLDTPLDSPFLAWMGSNHGVLVHPELGNVEYMYSGSQNLTLIGTEDIVFAISPENRNQFLQQFQRSLEYGALSTMKRLAVYPSFLFVEIWKLSSAKYLLLPALVMSISIFVWVGFAIPNYAQISLGFSPNGNPLPPVPGFQLILLPIINLFFLIFSVWGAAYFYRKDENHPIITFLFANSTLAGFVFLLSIFQILRIS